MRVGLVGTGVMGEPMAKNILKAGHRLTVYNRTPSRCESLRALGARIAPDINDVVGESEAVILMVPSYVEVDQALQRQADGRIGIPVDGKTIVLMATVAPSYSLELSASLDEAGARYVEAPVSGSRNPAEKAQLVIMASAKIDAHIDSVQPIFDALGKRTIRCGAVPAAMRMKLANQLMLASWFQTISEAAHFAVGIGLDLRQFLEMVEAGPLANDVIRSKTSKLLADDFSEQAAIRHVAKDIGLVCDEAEDCGLWLPIAQANRKVYEQAMKAGQSHDDAIGIVKLLRRGPID